MVGPTPASRGVYWYVNVQKFYVDVDIDAVGQTLEGDKREELGMRTQKRLRGGGKKWMQVGFLRCQASLSLFLFLRRASIRSKTSPCGVVEGESAQQQQRSTCQQQQRWEHVHTYIHKYVHTYKATEKERESEKGQGEASSVRSGKFQFYFVPPYLAGLG